MSIIFGEIGKATFADAAISGRSMPYIRYGAGNEDFNLVSAELVVEKKLLGSKAYLTVSFNNDGIMDAVSLPVGKKEMDAAKRLAADLNARVVEHAELLEKRHKIEEAEAKAREERRRAQEEKERLEKEAAEREQARLAACIYDMVVIDFETTGINSNPLRGRADEILSVAIIDQDGNVLMNELCSTEDRKTWKKAEEVHGIKPSMVKGKPTFSELLPSVKEILRSAKEVIAYNIPFEMGFLWMYDAANDFPGGWKIREEIRWGLDPMLMFSAYKGQLTKYDDIKWQKLTTATKHFKFDHDAHDALGDVRATLLVYNKMLEFVEANPDKEYIRRYGNSYDRKNPR